MADDKTTAQKQAERNSATRGDDGHPPVLIATDPAESAPAELAKANSATPATRETGTVLVAKPEGLEPEEAADLAKKNSATPPEPNAKPVLVVVPEETDDSLLTPTEFAARNAKAVKSSPENKSAAATGNK